MSTKYNLDTPQRYAPTGYEGQNYSDYVIPSCGLEDLDKAIFNLFDKDIPLYYMLQEEQRKIPVIFATGERFALIQRKELVAGLKVIKTLHDSSLMPGACVHPQWNCRHRLHRCCTNLGLELLQIWTGTATN